MPPRSRLYSLAPEGMETLEVESLTSYVARLARLYRVGPRFFLAEEIMPHLRYILHYYANFEKFGSFCRLNAMTMNGTGKVAKDWIDQLEQATMRTGLRDLTLQIWASGFPPSRLLRSAPVWCPSCYQEWQEQSCPIYQPLYWMLQTVTICFRHKRRLVEQCPHCQQMQSVIANKTLHGYCTQCTLWLGAHADQGFAEDIDEETLHWQHWVLACIKELRQTGTSTDALPWARLASGIAVCVEATGGPKKCAELVAIKKEYLSLWLKGKVSPTLNKLLEFCYVLGISPLQLMTSDAMTLRDSIHAKSVFQTPRPRHPSHRKIDGDRALALIAEVLEGHEAPLPVFELERRLGLTPRTLKNRFPRECALVTAQYRAYRNEQVQQRTEQRGNEVRKVMLSLHAQSIYPSTYQVAPRLSNPNIIRKPVGRSTWKAVIHELGLERTRKKK